MLAAALLAGCVAALVAIAVGELSLGLAPGAPSLLVAVGDLVIELQPPGAKDLMVALFGEADKLALLAIILLAAMLIGGLLGLVALRRPWVAPAGLGLAGVVGFAAALRQPLTEPLLAVVVTLAATLAGIASLWLLLRAIRPGSTAEPTPRPGMPDWDRRAFLRLAGGLTMGSLVASTVGRMLHESSLSGAPSGADLPRIPDPVTSLPPGSSFDVPGITPIVVPNDGFYRIDTALIKPRVEVDSWQLTIKGMVEREVTLTYDDLSRMPVVEQYVTIACVSNEVGGDLVGNALWTGVDLREVLGLAGVSPGATQIVGRSVDRWTAGFPTSWAMDPVRQPMIGLGMNGEPLPVDHGYPARLIVPGLYGYVSATKWLKEIELTTMEAFDGYWVPLGWAKEAPILTQSRIDVPRPGTQLAAGPQAVAGVAWAPDRGISGVELRVDDGPWLPADISAPLGDAVWVQWKAPWLAEPGLHRLMVRATDGLGETQTSRRTPPAPDGARGLHSIEVRVS